jgi:hypothetical protein
VADFTGRGRQLRQLDRLLATGQGSTAPTISAITGTAGIGKTALAVHWAHQVRDRFPDGQLHVDLRGYAPGPPLRPLQALTNLLHGLGMPAEQIPSSWSRPPGCTGRCWPAARCWCSWTTPTTPSRSVRCCRAVPAAWWS